jgi:hypothetical protein
METLLPGDTNAQSYSPQLKTVLKTYQLSAVKSLQGPSSALLGMDCKGLLQEQASFRFSPPNCTGNCGLDSINEHASIKEIEKRDHSPVPITVSCKNIPVEPLHEDSDDDPPDRPKVFLPSLIFYFPFYFLPFLLFNEKLLQCHQCNISHQYLKSLFHKKINFYYKSLVLEKTKKYF